MVLIEIKYFRNKMTLNIVEVKNIFPESYYGMLFHSNIISFLETEISANSDSAFGFLFWIWFDPQNLKRPPISGKYAQNLFPHIFYPT